MTNKAVVIDINRAGTVADQVVRRAPSMPKSIPVELEPEYRALMRELIAMPDWNNSRLHLVEGFVLALHAMRTASVMQRLTAANAVLRYSRALGIVHRDPAALKPTPSRPLTCHRDDFGEQRATGATRAPWSKVGH
jgi:hypothetical protein